MVQFNEEYSRRDDSFDPLDPFEGLQTPQSVHVLHTTKGEERYIFLFTDEKRLELLRLLGTFAADPQLSFSWYDAAVLSLLLREDTDGNEGGTGIR